VSGLMESTEDGESLLYLEIRFESAPGRSPYSASSGRRLFPDWSAKTAAGYSSRLVTA